VVFSGATLVLEVRAEFGSFNSTLKLADSHNRLSFGALEIPTSLLLLFVVMIVAAAAVLPVVMFGGIDSLKSYTGPLLLAWIALFSVTQYTLFSHGVYPILIVLATTTVSVAATVR
jgi:hypothetical protein